jgi:hypothetical protein
LTLDYVCAINFLRQLGQGSRKHAGTFIGKDLTVNAQKLRNFAGESILSWSGLNFLSTAHQILVPIIFKSTRKLILGPVCLEFDSKFLKQEVKITGKLKID